MQATVNSDIGVRVLTEMREENKFMPAGVDLSRIREIALLFNRTAAGAIFLADLGLVKPSQSLVEILHLKGGGMQAAGKGQKISRRWESSTRLYRLIS